MADIALPLPIAVAAAWLGLDVDSARLLREESPAISRMLGDFADPDAVEAGTAAFATLLTELLPLAADRRTHPRDDLLSFIGAGPDLELDDVVTTAVIIAVAGHETTANLLGAAMIRLLEPRPDGIRHIDRIDAVDDRLITELLRLDGPVQAVSRTATTDHVSTASPSAPESRRWWCLPPPTGIRPSSINPTSCTPNAPVPPRWPSATARTIASAQPWRASRSPWRCNASWLVAPSFAALRHGGTPRPFAGRFRCPPSSRPRRSSAHRRRQSSVPPRSHRPATPATPPSRRVPRGRRCGPTGSGAVGCPGSRACTRRSSPT